MTYPEMKGTRLAEDVVCESSRIAPNASSVGAKVM